jgi:hypothetical protein
LKSREQGPVEQSAFASAKTKGRRVEIESRTIRTSLQVSDAVLEGHGPDGDAGVELVLVEIEPTDGTGVDASTFLLESADELDSFDLGRARDGSGREDGPERIEPDRSTQKRIERKKAGAERVK